MTRINIDDLPPNRLEWGILEALWELGEGTMEEVVNRCKSKISEKRMRGLLQVMGKKGLLEQLQRERGIVFLAAVNREELTRLSVQRLLRDEFAGSLKDMILCEIESSDEAALKQMEELIRVFRTRQRNE